MLRRANALFILACLLVSGCGDDDGTERKDAAADLGTDSSPAGCPNAIASDEDCGACVKERGGASYCGDICDETEDCVDKTNPNTEPLVCHPEGRYCTWPCTNDLDCFITGDEDCDEARGVCDFIP